jgi:hypothetical protein
MYACTGVKVMIAAYADFDQFSAEKMDEFLEI